MTEGRGGASIRTLATGIPGLDDVLGGGLPEFSFNLVVGGPGSGKTTLVHQIRLQQVFANLLSNAIKFTPSEGTIEVRLVAADGEAEVQVADTGPGIDPAFLPRIFDRFTQADTSTTRRQGGLGLGLAIVRAFVERHGGKVQAKSAGLGQGATFTVRLPLVVAQEADDTRRAYGATTMAQAAGRARLHGVRVLVVEDDADGREVLTALLEVEGAKVTSAGSVREALDVLDGARPDVIVSDIGMPDEDGYTLTRRVRARELERGGAVPMIALTGYVNPDDRDRLFVVGFQATLRKPVDADEIVAAITSLTHGRGGAA